MSTTEYMIVFVVPNGDGIDEVHIGGRTTDLTTALRSSLAVSRYYSQIKCMVIYDLSLSNCVMWSTEEGNNHLVFYEGSTGSTPVVKTIPERRNKEVYLWTKNSFEPLT